MSEVYKSWWWENDFSYNGEYPVDWNSIPDRIRLSNGNTKTDKITYTQEELKDAGYKIVKNGTTGFDENTHILEYSDEKGYYIEKLNQSENPEVVEGED